MSGCSVRNLAASRWVLKRQNQAAEKRDSYDCPGCVSLSVVAWKSESEDVGEENQKENQDTHDFYLPSQCGLLSIDWLLGWCHARRRGIGNAKSCGLSQQTECRQLFTPKIIRDCREIDNTAEAGMHFSPYLTKHKFS